MLYLFENHVLDTDRRELRRGTVPVVIEPQAFDLLAYLIQNRERVVSKDDLIATIWKGRIISESALSTCINAARNALDDSGEQQRLIRTFPRKGFRFVGAAREERNSGRPASDELAARQSNPVSALPDKPSIAILSFTNMSGDPEQDYFADGMAEDITTALSKVRWFWVVSRNSAFVYRGKQIDVKQAARELGVRYVLEGSVRKVGTRARVTAQLLDAIPATMSGPSGTTATSPTSSPCRTRSPNKWSLPSSLSFMQLRASVQNASRPKVSMPGSVSSALWLS